MFREAKKLKKLFEKKKERKKDASVFLLVFFAKKNSFHSHNTQTSNQIPHHSHSSHERHTRIYIYYYYYINEFRGAQIGVTTHRRGRVRVVLFHPPEF